MSPCGMVMDYLRTFYTADVRISVDPEIIVKLRWYKAPDGARLFPTSHAFGSSVWETNARDYPQPSIGEVDLSRKWDKGLPPPLVTGQGTQTPLQWFRDGIPRSALPLGSVITDTCDQGLPETVLAYAVSHVYFHIIYYEDGSFPEMNAPGVNTIPGLQFLLERLNGGSYSLSVRLYKNDYTPSKTSVLSDFIEADYSGYVSGSITGSWFNITPPVAGTDVAFGTNNATTFFDHDGGGVSNTIYGLYLVDSATNLVLAAARLDTPKLMATAFDSLDMLVAELLKSVGP